MKLNQIITLASTGIFGVLAGFLVTSGQHKNIAQTVGASAVVGVGVSIASQVVNSNKLAKKEKEIADRERELEDKLRTSEKGLKVQLTRANEQSKHFENLTDFLTGILAAKIAIIEENKRVIAELEKVQQQLIDSQEIISTKDTELVNLDNQLVELKQRINQLETEAKQADADFDRVLEAETQAKFNKWVDDWTQPYDEIILDTLQLKDRLIECTKKLKIRSKDRKEFVLGYTDKLNDIAARAEDNFNKEKSAYLEQIEILNEKVARFQQLANGDLVEPIYKNVGYALHGKIANDIAKELFRITGIPLEVLGYQQAEELTRVGYGFSKSADSTSIVTTIQQLTKDIAKELRIYAIASVELSDISPVIRLNFRKEPPKPETHEAIYKAGLIPAAQFCDTVAKATDHKKKGKPTLRVMAATGEGKGIAVKNLLAYFANIEGWEIWLSDPVDGSDEDHWDTPKIATNAKDAGKSYQLFLRLHKERKDLKQPGFTDRNVLAVFDEFDKQHSKEDKEQAKQIMTAIRHSNQRQILIGQCAEVGANGWAWDDMKNCALLVLGASIGSLVKHLRQDFGWTTKKVNQVKREYEKFSTWADNLNVANPDIPNENQTRIGLLVVGDKYQFLELPIAHKGILKDGKAVFRTQITATPLSTNTQFDNSTNNNSTPVVEASKPVVRCPYCKSTNLRKNGKQEGTGKQYYNCKDCKTLPRKWLSDF